MQAVKEQQRKYKMAGRGMEGFTYLSEDICDRPTVSQIVYLYQLSSGVFLSFLRRTHRELEHEVWTLPAAACSLLRLLASVRRLNLWMRMPSFVSPPQSEDLQGIDFE